MMGSIEYNVNNITLHYIVYSIIYIAYNIALYSS